MPDNFQSYLRMHRDCRERDLSLAAAMSPEEVELSPDRNSVRIRKMVYAVMREVHRMRGFVRLEPSGSILYGHMDPQHRIGPLLAGILAERFPGTMIVLGNEVESWAALYLDGEVKRAEGGPLKEVLGEVWPEGCADLPGSWGRVWEAYYRSQYCPNRKNLVAFHRKMPRRDLSSAGLKVERNKNGTTLSDFL